MIYHQRDKRRHRKHTTTIASGIVIAAIVITVLAWKWPHAFTGVSQTAAKPVAVARGWFENISLDVFGSFRSKQALVQENEQLKQAVALADGVKLERDTLQARNTELEALVGRLPTDHKLVMGTILSKPGFSPYDTLIIDAGISENVKVGQIVLADSAIAVGTVTNVEQHTATISLYSTPDQKLNVLIGGHAIQAVAIGKGAGNFEIRLPRNTEVSVGDTVTLANDPQKILGSVEIIDVNPSDSFDKILFKGPVDVNKVRFLLVEVK